MKSTEEIFSLPPEEMSRDEQVRCLVLYALYFNRDVLSQAAVLDILNGWQSEFGGNAAAIIALRKRVQDQKARA